jgi:tetratricopeptide (TPR) repeat protein
MADAQAAEAREDWKAAEESYLGVIRLAPAWAEVLVNLAAVYNREGKTAEAIDVLKGAAQLKPKLVEAHLNLGVTYFKTARYGFHHINADSTVNVDIDESRIDCQVLKIEYAVA